MNTDQRPSIATAGESKLNTIGNGLIIWIGRHWLFLFNTAWAVYLLTPFLAPVLMQMGLTGPARGIYAVYSALCHQLPDHSYFLFAPTPVPQDAELIAAGMTASSSLWDQRTFIGTPGFGWKVALCERDVAIYASVFLSGLLYGLVRGRLRPLPFKIYVLFLIPIAVDGLTQMVGWRESNWLLRTITGALFGFASVWLAYPYVDEAMQEVVESELERRGQPSTQP